MNRLPSVRQGLLSHPLDGQVLVYDTGGDRVHLLDPTTACVLELLQEGGRTREEVAEEAANRLGITLSEAFFPLAIDELHTAGLLEESAAPVAELPDISRRELVRTLVAAGVAAVAIPTIASLTATVGAAQPGQSFRGVGQACGPGAVCAAGLNCCAGICRALKCNNAPCGVGTECQGGFCCGGACSSTVCPGGAGTACTTTGNCNSPLVCTNATCAGMGCGVCCATTLKAFNVVCGGDSECCSGDCKSNGKCG